MKVFKQFQLALYILLFNLYSFAAFANDEINYRLLEEEEFADDPGFPTNEDPGTAAPIDSWVYAGLVLGILLLYYYWKRQSQCKV